MCLYLGDLYARCFDLLCTFLKKKKKIKTFGGTMMVFVTCGIIKLFRMPKINEVE